MQKNLVENLDTFACFILCHGRPNKVLTYKTLRKYGYTGKIYLIVDDEDTTVPEYQKLYGVDMIKIFSKTKALALFDTMTTEDKRNCAVYARNSCWGIAKELGLQYFCQLDDDYFEFQWRYPDGDALRMVYPITLDEVFIEAINFMNLNENIYSVAFAQTGDYIGGKSAWEKKLKRKCMATWICDIDKPIQYNGVMNDDVNAYVLMGSRGKLFFTLNDICINNPDTQQATGGMTEIYKGEGTYQKSFYTVVQNPSCVKIGMMGDNWYRIHHNIDWEHAVPKIISGRYKNDV